MNYNTTLNNNLPYTYYYSLNYLYFSISLYSTNSYSNLYFSYANLISSSLYYYNTLSYSSLYLYNSPSILNLSLYSTSLINLSCSNTLSSSILLISLSSSLLSYGLRMSSILLINLNTLSAVLNTNSHTTKFFFLVLTDYVIDYLA